MTGPTQQPHDGPAGAIDESLPPRERLIDAAIDLFSRDGFHATGIDRVLTRAGVAKMTLYNHFGSKEELICAAVREFCARLDTELRSFVARTGPDPELRVLAVFDFLAELTAAEDFHGCPVIGAAGEYSRRDSAIHRTAFDGAAAVWSFVEELVRQTGVADPAQTARAMALLVEGVLVASHISGEAWPALTARSAARTLLRAGLTA